MGLACHRLVQALPADKAADLERLLEALLRALDDGDAYARASLAISEFCVRHAGSRRLADLILSFGRQTARYTRFSLSSFERRQQSSANWNSLVKAVIAGDAIEGRASLPSARSRYARYGLEAAHPKFVSARCRALRPENNPGLAGCYFTGSSTASAAGRRSGRRRASRCR